MSFSNFNKNRVPLGLAAFLLMLLLAVHFGAFAKLGEVISNAELIQKNTLYFEASAKQAKDDALKLSEIYATLKVIGSADVGVSFIIKFQVEIGKTVAAFSKIIEDGIDISIISATASYVLVTLDKIASHISPFLFKLATIVTIIYLVVFAYNRKQHLTAILHIASEVCIVIFLVAYLLIPYSIHLSGWIGKEVTAELKNQNTEQINNLHDDVAGSQQKMGLKDRADKAVKELEKAVLDIVKKIELTSEYVIRHLAIAVIEGLLLPLGIFLVLSWALQRIAVTIRERIVKLQS